MEAGIELSVAAAASFPAESNESSLLLRTLFNARRRSTSSASAEASGDGRGAIAEVVVERPLRGDTVKAEAAAGEVDVAAAERS